MKVKKFIAFKILSAISAGLFFLAALLYAIDYLELIYDIYEAGLLLIPLVMFGLCLSLILIKLNQLNFKKFMILTFIIYCALSIIMFLLMSWLIRDFAETMIYFYKNLYEEGSHFPVDYLKSLSVIKTVRIIYIIATVLTFVAPFTLLGKNQFTNAVTPVYFDKNGLIQFYEKQATNVVTSVSDLEAKANDLLKSGAFTQEEYDAFVKKEIIPLKTKTK